MIYIIAPIDRSVAKIGYSANPSRRLKQLQTGSSKKLYIVATTKGTIAQERAIHQWLSPNRTHGEWFAWNEKIDIIIDRWTYK